MRTGSFPFTVRVDINWKLIVQCIKSYILLLNKNITGPSSWEACMCWWGKEGGTDKAKYFLDFFVYLQYLLSMVLKGTTGNLGHVVPSGTGSFCRGECPQHRH